MSSAPVSVQSSLGAKLRILRYLAAKPVYRNIDQISKQVANDASSAEKATRELVSLGLAKQSAKSENQNSYKISFKGEMAAASLLHFSLFVLVGVMTLVAGLESLSSYAVAGFLLAISCGLFAYTFFIWKAKRSLK
jgi:hypothetical protein